MDKKLEQFAKESKRRLAVTTVLSSAVLGAILAVSDNAVQAYSQVKTEQMASYMESSFDKVFDIDYLTRQFRTSILGANADFISSKNNFVDDVSTAVKSGNLAYGQYHLGKEYYEGGVSEEDYEKALSILGNDIEVAKGYAKEGMNALELMKEMFDKRPKRIDSDDPRSFLTDFLNGIANCEAGNEKYTVSVLKAVFPEINIKLQYFAEHIRLLIELEGQWYSFDQGNYEKVYFSDMRGTFLIDPLDEAKAFVGEEVDGQVVPLGEKDLGVASSYSTDSISSLKPPAGLRAFNDISSKAEKVGRKVSNLIELTLIDSGDLPYDAKEGKGRVRLSLDEETKMRMLIDGRLFIGSDGLVIDDFSFLKDLPGLKEVSIWASVEISEGFFSAVLNMPNLRKWGGPGDVVLTERINFANMSLSLNEKMEVFSFYAQKLTKEDLIVLSQKFPNLRRMACSVDFDDDFSVFANFKKLDDLFLDFNNKKVDLSGLSETRLEHLSLRNLANESNMSFLENSSFASGLIRFDISESLIERLPNLGKLDHLSGFYLSQCPNLNIINFGGIKNIKYFYGDSYDCSDLINKDDNNLGNFDLKKAKSEGRCTY